MKLLLTRPPASGLAFYFAQNKSDVNLSNLMIRSILTTLAITIATSSAAIAAPVYPSADNPIATAWVTELPTNCRRAPSTTATVEAEFTKSVPIALDVRTAVPGPTLGRFGGSRWFFEYSQSCWVHESRIFWMEDGDPRLHEVLKVDRR